MNVSATVCRVCGSDTLQFLHRPRVPVHQNLVCDDRETAVGMTRGELRLRVCPRCAFAFNAAFDPALLSYGHQYDNSQQCSSAFREYADELVNHLVNERGVRDARVLEVGCGNGAFLTAVVEADAGNIGYGFDPSYRGPATASGNRIRFERRFYDEHGGVQADVVICRHVIEHVSYPLGLLTSVRRALERSPGAAVYFETPCLEWILRNQVIWDFFYEHCSYFTERALRLAFEMSGFSVESVRHVFGGQYLWIEAAAGDPGVREGDHHGDDVRQIALEFTHAEGTIAARWRRYVQEARARGKVAIWGAGAKGVTFANLVDPDAELIDCVADLNPHKQGRFLPGTGHPIVDYRELDRRGVRVAVLMNPNYREENESLLQQAGVEIELVELAAFDHQGTCG